MALRIALRRSINRSDFLGVAKHQSTFPAKDYIDPKWETAKPYKSIPTPKVLKFYKEFSKGGRYDNLNVAELYTRWREDYGDLIRIKGLLGRSDIIVSYRPEDFEKVFRTEGAWPIRRSAETLAYYREKVRPDVFGEASGLLTTQGETWQNVRTLVNPTMMQPRIERLYVDKVDTVAREFLAIVAELRDEKSEVPANFHQWLNRWALETTGLLAMDTRLGVLSAEDQSAHNSSIISLVLNIFDLIYQIEFQSPWWKYFKTAKFKLLMKEFDNLTDLIMAKIDEAVQRFEKTPTVEGSQSVLEKLLKVNKRVAVVMAFDMLIAGIDTTSSSTVGILYCLAKNPEKQAKLREELTPILPHRDSPLTPDSVRNLPYLRACIKEGLRLHQPTPANVRKVGHNIVLQGYRVPKHTEVVMASLALHHDEKHFPQPKTFLPERWLADGVAPGVPSAKDAHPFIYLPFGFGARSCVGKRLALMEMEIIVARLVRRFEIGWNYGELKMKMTLTNTPSVPLQFELKDIID